MNNVTSSTGFTAIKYTITLDPTTQYRKPVNDYQVGRISNSLTLVTGLTIEEFSRYVSSPYSYTWVGGTFHGGIANSNWIQQSIFALDFDKGSISVKDAISRLRVNGIKPQVWYHSLSDSPELRKFRIVILLDEPVTSEVQRKLIAEGLLSLFPEADQKCKNASRFFYGGRESVILDHRPMSKTRIIDFLALHLITQDKGRARRVPSSLFSSSTPDFGEKLPFLYIDYRKVQISPNPELTKTTSQKGGAKLDFELARRNVRILDEFLKGTWLHHDQLFGLATHLVYIRGGRKLMTDTMTRFNLEGNTSYTQNNFNIMTYVSKVNYHPQPIYKFSPYEEDSDLYDIISATRDIRGQIEVTQPIEKKTLIEAETHFKTKLKEVVNNDSKKIYLFKLPTAIGKTEEITSLEGTIASPTHALKEQISGRMKHEHVTTPDGIVFENESLNRRIQFYYSIGSPTKATALLYQISNGNATLTLDETDIQRTRNYLDQLKASQTSNKSVLTTHARAIHTTFNHDTLIFDEDPISSLISVKQLSISDLQKLDNQTKLLNNDLHVWIEYLRSCPAGEIKNTPVFNIDVDQLLQKVSYHSNITSNVFDFFSSSFLLRDSYDSDLVHYVVKKDLPADKKVIIMSATIPVNLYEKFYGDRIEIIDIGDVEQVGSVIQHTRRSCSRHGLNRYVKEISNEVGGKPVITFKSFQDHFQNPVKDVYFGNCSGYDHLKGQDLVVVGTPHRNNVEYLLLAKVLGIDFKTSDTLMSYDKIKFNGFKFTINCYVHPELRNIQLTLIESDLVQAVGRARTLRTSARIDLYSSFPLRVSNEFIF